MLIHSMMKIQCLLAARDRCVEELSARVDEIANQCAEAMPAGGSVCGLTRLPGDFFAKLHPAMRGYDAAIELMDPGGDLARMCDAIEGLAPRIAELIHLDLSGAFAGSLSSVVPPEATPLRYIYLMRRRADVSHAEYIRYYRETHVEFGRRTPGIAGYEQHHLSIEASKRAADASGLRQYEAGSISELSIPSLEDFMKAAATSPVSRAAPGDEENFVDRANSVAGMFEVRVRVEV